MPKLLEPRRIARGVPHGVLNVAVSEVILNEPGIGSLVGKCEAASMAQLVTMDAEVQGVALYFSKARVTVARV
jgi:hypothetical protein